jgi:hypothetical protein
MINTREQLKRAYKLIKEEKTSEAEQLLRPILNVEPDNVHAWWLLAHSIDDPLEVRHALTTVLELDPYYENADKARELLAQLESFEVQAEPAAGGVFADFDEEMLLSSIPPGEVETSNLFGGTDADTMFSDQDDFLFDAQSQLPEDLGAIFEIPDQEEAGSEKSQKADKAAKKAAKAAKTQKSAKSSKKETDIANLFGDEPTLDDETIAAREERAARGGRGRRLVRTLLLLILVGAAAIALVMFVLPGDKAKEDSAPLQAVEVSSDMVRTALTGAEGDLAAAGLGTDNHALVANSDLGQTLFVEFCAQPGPQLAGQMVQGMVIAARQAAVVQNELAGVGVSINLCNGEQRDSLYRAVAPISAAVQYLNGQFGADEAGLAEFQETWQRS